MHHKPVVNDEQVSYSASQICLGMSAQLDWGVVAAAGEKARVAVEQGAAMASRYIEQAGDKLEQRYSAADNPRQLDPKTKDRCQPNPSVSLCCPVPIMVVTNHVSRRQLCLRKDL